MKITIPLLTFLAICTFVSTEPALAQSASFSRYVGIAGTDAVRMRVRGRNVRKFSGQFPIVCTNESNEVYSRTFSVSALDNISFTTNANGRFDYTFSYEDVAFRTGLVQVVGRINGDGGRVTVYVNTVDELETCEDAQFFRLTRLP